MRHVVLLKQVKYLGGHPTYDRPTDDLSLVCDDDGVRVSGFREKFSIPWSEVREVVVEGPDQASSRVTVTRLVALGPLAFGARKSTSEAYLEVATDAFTVAFIVPKSSAGVLRGKLAPWVRRLPQTPAPASCKSPAPLPPPATANPAAGWPPYHGSS